MKNKQSHGLDIYQAKAWRNEHTNAGFTKVIRIAEKEIVLVSVETQQNVTIDFIDADLLNTALLESGCIGKKMILLWDLEHVVNMTYRYKKDAANLIYNSDSPFKAIIFFNVRPEFMTTVETFAAIVQKSTSIRIVDTFQEAMSAIDEIRSGNIDNEADNDETDELFEQRKKEFLAVTGRLSWLNMLNQNINVPSPEDPVYPYFKAIENLQSDLSENLHREQLEMEQIKNDCERILTEKTIQLNAQQELYKQLKRQLEKEKNTLAARIASQEMELTRVSTAIAEKASTLQEMRDLISGLDIDAEHKEEMIRTCESMIETEMIEKKLNIELTTTDSEFLLKLQKKHPNLNQRELRICLLVKLNYDTKEIARSIGISTRGMESIRYRMHKKIGLTRHQSIKGYLTELAVAQA